MVCSTMDQEERGSLGAHIYKFVNTYLRQCQPHSLLCTSEIVPNNEQAHLSQHFEVFPIERLVVSADLLLFNCDLKLEKSNASTLADI